MSTSKMTYEDALNRFMAAKEKKRQALERMQQRHQDKEFCALVRQQRKGA